MLNGVLIGISVYLSNGINTISWNHISCFILVSNKKRLCHIIISSRKNYFIWKQRVPCIIRTFFWKLKFTSKVSIRNIHGTLCFHMKCKICITSQKYKVEQLPVLWNTENKPRQNVCLASCITSVDVHLISHSTGSGISQVYDHDRKSFAFFWVFRWKNNLHEIFF